MQLMKYKNKNSQIFIYGNGPIYVTHTCQYQNEIMKKIIFKKNQLLNVF